MAGKTTDSLSGSIMLLPSEILTRARSTSRSGNPAKRAAENAGAPAAPAVGTGSGFGLGGGAGAPSEADLAELQKLLGKG